MSLVFSPKTKKKKLFPPKTIRSPPRLAHNHDKNRYTDVLCLDDSRVVLEDQEGEDYINANYVDGYKHKNAFISTQGGWKFKGNTNKKIIII